MITLKRAYDAVSRTDGTRFLVERLWPRGISKATLRLDTWLKEVGPSTELRKWFSHDPDKWDEFRRRYFRELASQPEAWQPIVSAARPSHSRLQLARHATQQCACPAGVPAKQGALAGEVQKDERGAPAAALAAVIPFMVITTPHARSCCGQFRRFVSISRCGRVGGRGRYAAAAARRHIPRHEAAPFPNDVRSPGQRIRLPAIGA
jgi:uncharacterized protein YeaO (DUF488 family)